MTTIRVADYGADRLEAYDRLPCEPDAQRLAVAQRAGKGDPWRGWRVSGAGEVKTCVTKREARQWLELFADRARAAQGPDFYLAQFARLAAAVRAGSGAAVVAVLHYIGSEGDRDIADGLVEQMAACLFEMGATR